MTGRVMAVAAALSFAGWGASVLLVKWLTGVSTLGAFGIALIFFSLVLLWAVEESK